MTNHASDENPTLGPVAGPGPLGVLVPAPPERLGVRQPKWRGGGRPAPGRGLGLGDGLGRHSPITRALGRLCHFEMTAWAGDELAVRTAVPRYPKASSGGCRPNWPRCTTWWCAARCASKLLRRRAPVPQPLPASRARPGHRACERHARQGCRGSWGGEGRPSSNQWRRNTLARGEPDPVRDRGARHREVHGAGRHCPPGRRNEGVAGS